MLEISCTGSFHNIMHNDCLTFDYSICDIVSHLPIDMVKNEMICSQVSDYRGTFSLTAHNSNSIIYWVRFVFKTLYDNH